MSNAKQFFPRFVLRQTIGGKEYTLTGLGAFESGMAAREAFAAAPRNGSAVVIEQREARRHGVVYGITESVVGEPVRGRATRAP